MVAVTGDHGAVRHRAAFVGAGRAAAQRAVVVAVAQIADAVNALVGVNLEKIIAGAGGGRAGDEIIVDDVVAKDAAGIAAGVTGLIIIDDVVDKNRVGLGERLAVVRVDPKVVDVRSVAAFDVRAELLVDRVGDDAVLHREVGGVDGVNAVPLAELHGDVIENHVAGRAGATGGADVDAALAGAGCRPAGREDGGR